VEFGELLYGANCNLAADPVAQLCRQWHIIEQQVHPSTAALVLVALDTLLNRLLEQAELEAADAQQLKQHYRAAQARLPSGVEAAAAAAAGAAARLAVPWDLAGVVLSNLAGGCCVTLTVC
jgi:hypothetical protein